MKIKSVRYLYAWSLALVMLLGASPPSPAQTTQPEREKLLNGLSIIFVPRPGDANILVKLRIHSGAAFDLNDKSGTMSMLADAMFPDAETREYVREQLEGKLDVTTDYDAINVTISGKATEFERMIELIRNAVISTNLSAEAVTRIGQAQLKQLSEKPLTASEVADRAIAARLFGAFPYARPTAGTTDTIKKIVRADLMLAQERFLHADNASLAIIGGVEKPRLMRALRQLLGPWQKSDRTVPATFRQPDAPDPRVLVIQQSPTSSTEVRIAVRGLSRSDRDALAAQVLARIARERWQSAVADLSATSVRDEQHALPGIFLFSARVGQESSAKAVSAAREMMNTLAQSGPTAAEFERARAAVAAELAARMNQSEGLADAALDLDTYKMTSAYQPMSDINRLTANDVQRVAARLFKDATVATVVVGDAEQLKAAFGSNVEVRGATAELKTKTAVPASTPRP